MVPVYKMKLFKPSEQQLGEQTTHFGALKLCFKMPSSHSKFALVHAFCMEGQETSASFPRLCLLGTAKGQEATAELNSRSRLNFLDTH